MYFIANSNFSLTEVVYIFCISSELLEHITAANLYEGNYIFRINIDGV